MTRSQPPLSVNSSMPRNECESKVSCHRNGGRRPPERAKWVIPDLEMLRLLRKTGTEHCRDRWARYFTQKSSFNGFGKVVKLVPLPHPFLTS